MRLGDLMFLKDEVASIIECAALEDRLSYKSLTDQERNVLVAYHLYNSDQGLIDADYRQLIQKSVAKVILCNGHPESICGLLHAIEVAFLTGDKEYSPHYADVIETLLSDKWDDNHRRPNEHFENDAMQRARDVMIAQRRLKIDC